MGKESNQPKKFKIQRYNPERGGAPYFQEYWVPPIRGATVLDGLIYIKENLDSTLTFRSSCRMYVCGSCGMLINDYPQLACHTQIDELNTPKITLKPLSNFPIIKDLVTNLDSLFEKHRLIRPYILRADSEEIENPNREFTLTPKELDYFQQFSHCIKCGICLAACPTIATDKYFLGPQALSQCYRYCADNRDEGEKDRLSIVSIEHGVWDCHLAGACSEACPKGVDPAFAIQLLKRRLVARALGIRRKRLANSIISFPTGKQPRIPFPQFNVNDNP